MRFPSMNGGFCYHLSFSLSFSCLDKIVMSNSLSDLWSKKGNVNVVRCSSCQILGVSTGSLESQAILFKYLHQWAADQMHLCQRRKTEYASRWGWRRKNYVGQRNWEDINGSPTIPLPQFRGLKIFFIYFTSTFAHEAVSSTHEEIFVDKKRGNEGFQA